MKPKRNAGYFHEAEYACSDGYFWTNGSIAAMSEGDAPASASRLTLLCIRHSSRVVLLSADVEIGKRVYHMKRREEEHGRLSLIPNLKPLLPPRQSGLCRDAGFAGAGHTGQSIFNKTVAAGFEPARYET